LPVKIHQSFHQIFLAAKLKADPAGVFCTRLDFGFDITANIMIFCNEILRQKAVFFGIRLPDKVRRIVIPVDFFQAENF
jgi:hypothetical protein